MIAVSDLVFRYPNSPFELRVSELAIQHSECVAVVGPSGSGKTTLLNLLSGILQPNSGTISLAEKQVSGLTDSQRRDFRIANIGFVFQDFELIEYLDVRENILLPCFINSSLPLTKELRSRAEELAQSLGMGDKLARPVQQLSQGERQRVAICRALL
ncbi:MAG: ABC transporter ATP-binding protein, partial [Planctomycetaceae bacterium]